MNRGDRRKAILPDEHDRQMFMDALGHACEKIGTSGKFESGTASHTGLGLKSATSQRNASKPARRSQSPGPRFAWRTESRCSSAWPSSDGPCGDPNFLDEPQERRGEALAAGLQNGGERLRRALRKRKNSNPSLCPYFISLSLTLKGRAVIIQVWISIYRISWMTGSISRDKSLSANSKRRTARRRSSCGWTLGCCR